MGIQKFTRGSAAAVQRLNEMIDEIEAMKSSMGTGRIQPTKSGSGSVNVLSMNQTRPRIAKQRNSQIGILRRARTTEAATANDQITCNLYDHQGIERTSGSEFNVEVYFSIMNSTALNTSQPRLLNDKDIFVTLLPFNNAGTVEYRWYCVADRQSTEVCS